MIHYIYRIDFLCGEPGRYYLGKRSYRGRDINKDKYGGSGNFCFTYYEKYGQIVNVTYRKIIIEINKTFNDNRCREEIIIGDLWKTDPLCMNECPGGGGVKKPRNTKKVVQFDTNGNIVNTFNSIVEAHELTGTCKTSISNCCNGKSKWKMVNGFIWRFDGDPFDKFITPKYKNLQSDKYKKVNQYSIDGAYIRTWDCPFDIVKSFDKVKLYPHLLNCLYHKGRDKTALGYRWEFFNGNTNDIPKLIRKKESCPVKQYDLNGNFIKEYSSCRQAALDVIGNHHSEKIKQCAEGLIETAFGFKWILVK